MTNPFTNTEEITVMEQLIAIETLCKALGYNFENVTVSEAITIKNDIIKSLNKNIKGIN
jgi:hypothetical protein